MAEQTPTLTAAFLASAGSVVSSDYGVILLAALVGASWPLSKASTQTRVDGALMLLRLVGTAFALTGGVSWLVEHYVGLPASKAGALIAWTITAFGDHWTELLAALKDRVASFVSGSKQ